MKRLITLLFLLINAVAFAQQEDTGLYRSRIGLSGGWQFAADPADSGMKEKWFLKDLPDRITLPGTTDLNQKGTLNKDTSTMHLNRVYIYEGAAWYRKKITVPREFKNKRIMLYLERTKSSTVWIDGKTAGGSALLQSPQQFDVTPYLSPGEHYLTIRIDNRLKLTPYGNVHIYSDDTQTNWNGIIGKIFLEASDKTYISDLQVYPDIDKQKIEVRISVGNYLKGHKIAAELNVKSITGGTAKNLPPLRLNVLADSVVVLNYNMEGNCNLWDENHQPLYEITAAISHGKSKDAQKVSFGMRKFSRKGTQFSINGRVTFLRGKHDACVFPLTGHPPMDTEGWTRVFRIAKSYGINHYRFHSYCPPEAAFAAADQAGIYIQAELPFWGGLNEDTVAAKLKQEGMAMLRNYANHPSFVMFSHGNEIWSGQDKAEKNIRELKQYDSRPLYTLASNVNIGYYPPPASSDFFVGARTPSNGDTVLTHVRLTHAFSDSRQGGLLNTATPSTELRFSYPVSQLKIPVVSHEIGQYQVYPDYAEIEKYTGILKARNLEVFRDRLKKAGMQDQDKAFQKASGAWAAICYKAEMEAALRTKGFGGFQLLDLQDFPGQGTALVGILDAFMDSKNVVTREEWIKSCNEIVVLAEFPKYCWVNTETFRAKIEVANYSDRTIKEDVRWEIRNSEGLILKEGLFTGLNIENEGVKAVGELSYGLGEVRKAEKLTVTILIKGTPYQNSYPVWVYPQPKEPARKRDIYITNKYDKSIRARLEKGAKVILFPSGEDVRAHSVPGLFTPEFWNWEMFKSISESLKKPVSPGTLGLLTNPQHPLFQAFPTDFHTNWQWFSIIKAANPLLLDRTSASFRPIVQVIDNLQRNHKLGLIFEFKVGKGKLLVCMSPLNKMLEKPEAAQLYQSIIDYINTKDFNPDYEISSEEIENMLYL